MKLPNTFESISHSWIPTIYREKVRSQRTRSYELKVPERENQAEIFFTLLGIELKVGKRRFSCPDLATARYLLVFARLGCTKVAIPYDITKISVLADEFEVAWQTLLLMLEENSGTLSPRSRGRRRGAVIRRIREDIYDIGAGEIMPEFKTSTSQRKS